MLHLVKGDWSHAHAQIEQWLLKLQAGNVTMHLPWALAASGWALAQQGARDEPLSRVRQSEQLLE